MKQRLLAMMTIAACSLALASPALATGPFSLAARQCSERIERETRDLVTTVHNEIRQSISANLSKNNAPCSGPFACAGGPKNNVACTSNATCGSAGGVPFPCAPKLTAGSGLAIKTAKANLRAQIALCTPAALTELFGSDGSHRCAGANNPGKLADCILRETIGFVVRDRLRATVGEILGVGAPDMAVDTPIPTGLCSLNLGGITDVGSVSGLPLLTHLVGAVEPLTPVGCTSGNPVCPTKGRIQVGNLVDPPLQTFAGIIPICITTRAQDAGNGTTEAGQINLATGEQHSDARWSVALFIGQPCPICNQSSNTCDVGPHAGAACTSPGTTDIACPPSSVGNQPTMLLHLDRSTEGHLLTAPVNNPGGGVSNPSHAFCGACDLDLSVGCVSDGECTTAGVCSGAGCCVFSATPGAFGNPTLDALQAQGTRGPFVPELASLACTGMTGDGLVDTAAGLPGPMRHFDLRLNQFQWN